MAKKTSLSRLNKPVHLVLAVALIALAVIAVISVLVLRSGQNTTAIPQQNQAQSIPTVTPTPIDMSSWKTWTDWKYGYSLKLPPEYYAVIPGKGRIDNPGGEEMDFETNDLGGPEGVHVRISSRSHVDFNNTCTTDQDCFALLYNFYKPLPNTKIYFLQTKILDRNIKGLGIESTSSGTGVYVYYEFTKDGKPYELQFYDVGSYDAFRLKQPFIEAVASTISFSQ